jgi:hypothetical protein
MPSTPLDRVTCRVILVQRSDASSPISMGHAADQALYMGAPRSARPQKLPQVCAGGLFAVRAGHSRCQTAWIFRANGAA